jgi:GGDEF domain-containing protein
MNVLAYTDAVTGLPNRAVITHIFSLAQQQQPILRGRWCSSIWTGSSG